MSEQTPDTINIKLQLGDHPMRFIVPWNEEVYYRKAADYLNKRFQNYSNKNKGKSAEQIWVYVALEAAMNLERQAARYELEPVMERIGKINQSIIEALNGDASQTDNKQL